MITERTHEIKTCPGGGLVATPRLASSSTRPPLIPLFRVGMSPHASAAAARVLSSGHIGQGPEVERLEALLRTHLASRTCPVTTNSCTSAIDLALEICDVGPDSEVITTPMTCIATNAPLLHRRARILWADVDSYTGLIDPASVRKLLTPRTAAIIAVDWAGQLCDYHTLRSLGPPVIQDAAHVFAPCTDRGHFTCYSFQAIKFLTTGDGGALVCESPDDEKRARLLRWFGLDRSGPPPRCNQLPARVGFKYHMNDIAAAIGIANLNTAIHNVAAQRRNCQHIVGRASVPDSPWLCTLVPPRAKFNALAAYLDHYHIEHSRVHRRNDIMPGFPSSPRPLPGVDHFDTHQINVPCGWWLSPGELELITSAIRDHI